MNKINKINNFKNLFNFSLFQDKIYEDKIKFVMFLFEKIKLFHIQNDGNTSFIKF